MFSGSFASLWITLLYSFPNLRMEEISYVLALLQAFTDESGTDLQYRSAHQFYIGG